MLAECPEDIIPLAEFFRERHSKELKRETQGFTDDAKRRMLAYPWPGNVRELQNKIKRSVLVSEEPILDIEGLDNGIPPCDNGQASVPAVLPLKDESLEKKNIVNALKACNGHREQAAAMLNVNPATLYRKMKKYGCGRNRRHYKIFCVNVKYGIQYGFRIFYLIALQNEENYEREESCSA